jgi:hypothetical protein
VLDNHDRNPIQISKGAVVQSCIEKHNTKKRNTTSKQPRYIPDVPMLQSPKKAPDRSGTVKVLRYLPLPPVTKLLSTPIPPPPWLLLRLLLLLSGWVFSHHQIRQVFRGRFRTPQTINREEYRRATVWHQRPLQIKVMIGAAAVVAVEAVDVPMAAATAVAVVGSSNSAVPSKLICNCTLTSSTGVLEDTICTSANENAQILFFTVVVVAAAAAVENTDLIIVIASISAKP